MKKGYARFLHLALLPAGVHLFVTVFCGIEVDGSVAMLMLALLASAAGGAFLAKLKYGPVESALAAAWPGVLASWRHWYWSLDMPSPGGAAQAFMRLLGWPDASAAAAVAVLLIPAGAVGWGFQDFNRWYEKKTGRPLFEES